MKEKFSPFPLSPKKIDKGPPDNIFYSVHIALQNIFPKPELMHVSHLVSLRTLCLQMRWGRVVVDGWDEYFSTFPDEPSVKSFPIFQDLLREEEFFLGQFNLHAVFSSPQISPYK